MRFALLMIGLAACGGSSPMSGSATCNFTDSGICSTAVSTTHGTSTLDKDCTAAGGAVASDCSTTNLVGTCSNIESSDGIETINLYSPTFDATTAADYCANTTGTFSTP